MNGIVYGTKPYVFNGQLIKGFHVTFQDGRVVEHGAEEGAELLGQLLDTDEGARSIGEVALVPASSPHQPQRRAVLQHPSSTRTPPATSPLVPAIPAPPRAAPA